MASAIFTCYQANDSHRVPTEKEFRSCMIKSLVDGHIDGNIHQREIES